MTLHDARLSPRVQPTAHGYQLLIDGEPTLLLGGQLHNSTPSSLSEIPGLFSQLKAMNATFGICGVSWAVVEDVEGSYDFSHVDVLLEAARTEGLRLVLIWFGAFKNAKSTYAPTWVRKDTHRFPRAEVRVAEQELFTYEGAMPVPVLSVFSPELRAADSRAYRALVAHLVEHDPQHTVIMLQVENEVGLLRDSRDRSELAERVWREAVPQQLLTHLQAHRATLTPALRGLWELHGARTAGTWTEVFGTEWAGEEVFMAWAFASYVESLAQAASEITDRPQYVNVWLGPQPGQERAGQYPSGGAGEHVIDVWKAAAPTLAFISPDVYEDDAKAALAPYRRPDNPLFVPESRFRTGQVFWALGQLGAIGYSVFSIEDGLVDGQLAEAYGVLGGLTPSIVAAQAEGRIAAALLEEGERDEILLGDYRLTVQSSVKLLNRMLLDAGVQAPPISVPPRPETREGISGPPGWSDTRSFGIVILLDENTLLVAGRDLAIDASITGEIVEVDRVEAGRFVAGEWHTTRVINGDERLQLLPMDRVGVVKISLLRRPAPSES